ncbi:MAG: hypothetical protein PHT90_03740 [Bacilli bacterium]|nr:hypothetical protein [Bacilli bacterium]
MKKILLLLVILFTNIIVINAASLKKDDQQIKIEVINAFNSEYILDILFVEEDNVNNNTIPSLSANYIEKINIIRQYDFDDEFKNSLIRGSIETLEGNLKGIQLQGSKKVHNFVYNTYQEDSFGSISEKRINYIKIIVVDDDNNVQISEILELKQYNSYVKYNYENHLAIVINPSLNIIYFTLFSVLISLLISLFIFTKLKFNIKELLIKFGLITGLASTTLTMLVANALYYDNGLFALYTLIILGIINILFQSIILYSINKHKKAFLFGFLSAFINMIIVFLVILLI